MTWKPDWKMKIRTINENLMTNHYWNNEKRKTKRMFCNTNANVEEDWRPKKIWGQLTIGPLKKLLLSENDYYHSSTISSNIEANEKLLNIDNEIVLMVNNN